MQIHTIIIGVGAATPLRVEGIVTIRVELGHLILADRDSQVVAAMAPGEWKWAHRQGAKIMLVPGEKPEAPAGADKLYQPPEPIREIVEDISTMQSAERQQMNAEPQRDNPWAIPPKQDGQR